MTAHVSARRSFIAGSAATAATFGIVRAPAKAAQFEFKCASSLPLDHPVSVRVTQMWNAVEKESGGRIRTKYFPNAILGSENAMLTQVRLGALSFYLIPQGTLAGVVPTADIGSLGFAFKDADEGLRVMDGPLGDYVRGESIAKGIYAQRSMWNSGMYQTGSNSHPIRTPDDYRGFKVRVLESKILVELFKALGASPVSLSLSEIYTALQTHIVDGESVPLVTIAAARFYEVNKYISMTNHAWSAPWMISSAEIWKSIPPDLQAIVERNNIKYSRLERRDTNLIAASVADRLTRQGMLFNSINPEPFRTRLASYYESWESNFGAKAWGYLQSSLGHKLG